MMPSKRLPRAPDFSSGGSGTSLVFETSEEPGKIVATGSSQQGLEPRESIPVVRNTRDTTDFPLATDGSMGVGTGGTNREVMVPGGGVLILDEHKTLTNGDNSTIFIDTDEVAEDKLKEGGAEDKDEDTFDNEAEGNG